MTLYVKLNDPHFQYRPRVSQGACGNLVIPAKIWDELSARQVEFPRILSSKWPKWLWRFIRSMTPIFDISWEYAMMHVWCKHGDSSSNLRCIIMRTRYFLAATKQLYEWFSPSVRPSVCPSVRPSVCLSHLFDYVPIILSSWTFQELLPVTKVMSMQKVKVRGQRSGSQRSQPNFTVSGL